MLLAYLTTFLLDRLWDTPAEVRLGHLRLRRWSVCALVPLALHRWIWRQRRLEQLARLLSRTYPRIGDQLLGIIELVRNEFEQARSLVLCEAAVQQVAEQARSARLRLCRAEPASTAGGPYWPAAPGNRRWTAGACTPRPRPTPGRGSCSPWRDTPRYTFAMVDALPDPTWSCPTASRSRCLCNWPKQTVSRPNQAEARIGVQQPVVAPVGRRPVRFELPPQIEAGRLDIRVGDFTKRIHLEPTLRPELSGVEADSGAAGISRPHRDRQEGRARRRRSRW